MKESSKERVLKMLEDVGQALKVDKEAERMNWFTNVKFSVTTERGIGFLGIDHEQSGVQKNR